MTNVATNRQLGRGALGPREAAIAARGRALGGVGPYRLCLELAAGGMASIYLARREQAPESGQIVALKLIHAHLARQREFIEMFMDEAELAARIRHPNVCAVLDYELQRDEPYLALEYLPGESLMTLGRRIAETERLDPGQLATCVARILADACAGLHAAHELTDSQGRQLHVVHRDVSLENIIVTYDGVAKVMDFGVAAAEQRRHHTRAGTVKGKLSSVAPECLKGQKPDRRADVWAIGVIAWELLTGRRLFRRTTAAATLYAVIEAPIARPSQCRPGLPRELDEIVMRALQRDPEQRYPTAHALQRDLARFCATWRAGATAADVAEWLGQLFPGGRERRARLLAAAQAGVQASADPARAPNDTPALAGDSSWPPPAYPATGSTIEALLSRQRPTQRAAAIAVIIAAAGAACALMTQSML